MCTNTDFSLVDIFTLVISISALIATLRKKEFGTIVFVDINNENVRNDIWIKIIKSDIYNVTFKIKSKQTINSRVKLLYSDKTESVLFFLDNKQISFEIPELKPSERLEITNFTFEEIQIKYIDKYNNRYKQTLKKSKITDRRHINCWNLTFVGS